MTPGARLVDLSHAIEHGLETYRGLPAPVITDFMSREQSRSHYAPGTEFHIGRIDMVANTGTYLDAPFHRHAAGADLAGLPLERLADLVRTGHDRHWRSDRYFTGHPFLTAAAARLLVERGAALVGIDSLNIDDTADGARPVHTLLLAAGIPIVEHLTNLAALPDPGGDRFRFFAVPPKVRAFGTFPVRAFAAVR